MGTTGYTGPDWAALVGAALTAGLHLVLQAQRPSPGFMIGACLFWAIFVLVRASQNRNAFRNGGFRADNLGEAAVAPAITFAAVASAFGAYAYLQGTLRFPGHAGLLLLLYPVWGLVQQFLVLSVVVSNLDLLPGLRRRRLLVVVVGAALFGLVHVHDARLATATFLLELLIVPLYLRHRNLWPLGVLHGWLGLLFYLWVLNRDLWIENFG